MTNTITQPTSTKKRLAYLDMFRLIAAIAVVVIHVTASAIGKYNPGSIHQFIVTLINGVALFAVPAFIFISGYTFMAIYRHKSISFASFLKKRIMVLFIPYIVWSLIYYLDQLYFSAQPFSVIGFSKTLLTGSAFYHLYFMPIIFQFYLLFIPLKMIAEKISSVKLGVLTLLIYYVYTSGLPMAENISWIAQINALLPLKADFLLSDRLFLSYLPFYMFGMLIGLHYERFKEILHRYFYVFLSAYGITAFLHVANRIAYYVYQQNFPYVLPYAWELSSFGAILMILWICQKSEPLYENTKSIGVLSSYTFDLYLAHPLILQFGEIFLRKIGVNSVSITLILIFTAAILVPLAGADLKARLQRKLSRQTT